MKPKTKQQKEVYALSKQLPPLTETQKKWAEYNCKSKIGCNSGTKTWCLHCNSMFKTTEKTICPHCGSHLEIKDSKARTFRSYSYFSIITTCKGWQVIRHFQTYQSAKKNSHNEINICEIIQIWMNEKGEYQVIARKQHSMNSYWNYDDCWDWMSYLEIRTIDKRYGRMYEKYDLFPFHIYPRIKTLPILRRNGFSNEFYLTPFASFYYLIKDWKFEVLWKNKQISLLKRFCKFGTCKELFDKRWSSIKIANRHHYQIQDADLWIDYWNLLNRFGYDTNNPYYICPKDLKEAHDAMVKKKEKQDKIERMKQALKDNEQYIEHKGKYFGLCFISAEKDIEIKVITSLNEMYDEGKEMHHCVFANEYYKKDDSLILTAKDNHGIRLETIEVDLKNFNVVQSRSKFNGVSPQHDRIVSLVKKNMRKIKKIAVA